MHRRTGTATFIVTLFTEAKNGNHPDVHQQKDGTKTNELCLQRRDKNEENVA